MRYFLCCFLFITFHVQAATNKLKSIEVSSNGSVVFNFSKGIPKKEQKTIDGNQLNITFDDVAIDKTFLRNYSKAFVKKVFAFSYKKNVSKIQIDFNQRTPFQSSQMRKIITGNRLEYHFDKLAEAQKKPLFQALPEGSAEKEDAPIVEDEVKSLFSAGDVYTEKDPLQELEQINAAEDEKVAAKPIHDDKSEDKKVTAVLDKKRSFNSFNLLSMISILQDKKNISLYFLLKSFGVIAVMAMLSFLLLKIFNAFLGGHHTSSLLSLKKYSHKIKESSRYYLGPKKTIHILDIEMGDGVYRKFLISSTDHQIKLLSELTDLEDHTMMHAENSKIDASHHKKAEQQKNYFSSLMEESSLIPGSKAYLRQKMMDMKKI